MRWLEFELMIMDSLDEEQVKSVEELQELADDYHNHIERAFQDWASDNGLDDYSPMY